MFLPIFLYLINDPLMVTPRVPGNTLAELIPNPNECRVVIPHPCVCGAVRYVGDALASRK